MAVRDKNAIRQEIIGVARNFFIKNGVDATSMEAIAVANGVSKPTIYEYFTNKTDLIQAVVESAVRDVDGSLLKSASQGEISFEEYLDRLLADCFEAVTSETRSVLPKLIVMEGPRSSEMARTLRALRHTELFRLFEATIATAVLRGECIEISPIIASQLILGPLGVIALKMAYEGTEGQDREAIRSYLDHYFLMLKNHLLVRPAETQKVA